MRSFLAHGGTRGGWQLNRPGKDHSCFVKAIWWTLFHIFGLFEEDPLSPHIREATHDADIPQGDCTLLYSGRMVSFYWLRGRSLGESYPLL